MISVLLLDGKWCPMVACDVCGEMIKTKADGVAVFPMVLTKAEYVPLTHAHKFLQEGMSKKCFTIAEEAARKEAKIVGWKPIGEMLEEVSSNLDMMQEWAL